MSRVPPNLGISLYIVKRRRRYEGLSCGKWQKWVGVRYCQRETEARRQLDDVRSTLGLNEQAEIFHKGKQIDTRPVG